MSNTGNANFFVHSLLRARGWQHRPQLDEVCDWWRAGGQGVCALVGIGGAGKTAIADRFLQVVPGVLPAAEQTPKDNSLPVPHSVFVFSFYDAPNPEAFFDALTGWLQTTVSAVTVGVQDQATGRVSYHQVVQWLQGAPPGLLILDGLERIQEDGTRGGIFGRIGDGNLRDFLTRLAEGWLPHLSALITSRFTLADLDEASPTWYRPIDVDKIDVPTGINLLRQRGVTGTDAQLADIVDNCGRHALTVDMAGGLLCEFHNADPTTSLEIGTAEEIEQAASKEQDPRRRAARKQELRFAKVAGRYREGLEKKDKAALALLERVCLFRLGADAETLASIFTGKGSQKVAGVALSRLKADGLQEKLDLLVRMGLLESNERKEVGPVPTGRNDKRADRPVGTGPTYSIHPAVRDGFLSGIGRDAAVAGHEAVRKGLEVSLGESPGKNPSDPATLDLLEEIVHHTLQSGHVREAWDIYWNRIGCSMNLMWRLGAYERGERICREFAGGQSAETVVSQYRHHRRPDQAKRSSGSTGSPSHQIMPEHRRSAPRSGLRNSQNEEAAGPLHPDGGEQGLPPSSTSAHSSPAALPPATRSDGRRTDEAPFLDLPEDEQAIFINEWALYLQALGRLAAAARCYELNAGMAMRQENWEHASIDNQNLCEVWLLSGRLSRSPQAEGGRTAAMGRRKDETDESLPPSSFIARPSEASPATSARLGASRAGALATADEALRLAALADDAHTLRASHSYRAHVCSMRGEVSTAFGDFRAALDWQHKNETHAPERPHYSGPGVWHTLLVARLGRDKEATRLANRAKEIQQEFWGPTDFYIPKYQLVLSSLSLAGSFSGSSSSVSSAALWTQARNWAQARDAKEVLCWSCLVEAQHALANHDRVPLAPPVPNQDERAIEESTGKASGTQDSLGQARTALESGLKIARDCGYGLFHIDLLLERARLHLLQGNAEAALTDIEMALGDESGQGGIPEAPETGQPELLAARHPPCGYAWPIPTALQLRAEAQLQKAAQACGSVADPDFVVKEVDHSLGELDIVGDEFREAAKAKLACEYPNATLQKMVDGRPEKARTAIQQIFQQLDSRLPKDIEGSLKALRSFFDQRIDRTNVDNESPHCNELNDALRATLAAYRQSDGFVTAVSLRKQAVNNLNEALELWQPLHDPEPEREDQNFKLNGKDYNYKAAETHQILTNLDGGVLTRYPLEPHNDQSITTTAGAAETPDQDKPMASFDVFLSHNSEDKPATKRLGEALKKRGLTVWLDEWELAPGSSWIDELENIISTCGSSAVCVGASGLGPWEKPEMQGLLIRFINEKKTGKPAPVIPVLLPDAPADVVLPVFLQTLTWLDLRDGLKKEQLDRLQWGITGIKPTT